jgi:tripartite ATP-independent transporter DctM subunit
MWKALAVVAAIIVGFFVAFKGVSFAQATFNSAINWILLALAIGSFLVWGGIKTANNKKEALFGVRTLFDAIPSLLLLIIVIGGIVAGYFTATEASAIAVLYSLILALIYGEISMKHLPVILLRSVKTTAIVLLLVATSIGLSWVMAYENIPQNVSEGLLSLSSNPIVILLVINLILLFVGVFMDMTPAVLIFTPIFLPVVTAMGVDAVHFGIIMVLNLSVGLCTPPVGSVLFIGCSVSGLSIDKVIKPLIPMFIAMIVVLLLVTYLPQISLWLPHKLGF